MYFVSQAIIHIHRITNTSRMLFYMILHVQDEYSTIRI